MRLLCVLALCVSLLSGAELRDAFGYGFDPATGAVYSPSGEKQPYTFETAGMFDFVDYVRNPNAKPVFVRLNPLAFATAETANAMKEYVAKLAPGSAPKVDTVDPFGRLCSPSDAGYKPVGTFDACYTHPIRFIRVYTQFKNPADGKPGYPLSAGELANAVMRGEQVNRSAILADIERGYAALQK